MEKRCMNCGAVLKDDTPFCPYCGHPIESEIQTSTEDKPNDEKNRYCNHCGSVIYGNSTVCSKCGAQLEQGGQIQNTQNGNIQQKKSVSALHPFAIVLIIVIAALVFAWFISQIMPGETNTDSLSISGKTDYLPTDHAAPSRTESPEVTSDPVTSDPITGNKTSFKDLKIEEYGKANGMYIGLQYVKKMDYLPTALGKADVSAENEVILAFFELCNGTNEIKSFNMDDIKCYSDGVQVSSVENYINVTVDGINQQNGGDIDGLCQLLTVQDFEVKKGWKTLSFYYQSDCIWTVSPSDVKTSDYQRNSFITVTDESSVTEIDDIIYNDSYIVQYKGTEIFYKESYFSSDYNLVFKFHITNSGSKPLEMGLMGYEMRAYQNNFYLGTASFSLTDKISGYTNIYEIDSLDAGMSCDVYVAFECADEKGKVALAYDDGYIKHHLCGYVHAEID